MRRGFAGICNLNEGGRSKNGRGGGTGIRFECEKFSRQI